jgi:integrase
MAITLKIDTEKAGRAIPGGKMARRGFQQGSLFQRGTRKKVWVARWREDVIQTDGTIRRVRVSQEIGPVAQFPSRRLAMQVLSLKLASINNGTAKPQSIRTFASFVAEDWAPVVLPTLKYATQKHYRYMLDVHLIPAFGKTQLRDITREELQLFLSRKLAGGLSWETVHHFKCGLSKILGAAEEWGYITENLAQKTKLPRRQYGPERVVLTAAQIRDLAALLDEPTRSIMLLLVLTGLRVGEMLALRWGNIDVKARMLRVCETVYEGHFDRPKTKRSVRTIPIGKETAEILVRVCPALAEPTALVFATREAQTREARSEDAWAYRCDVASAEAQLRNDARWSGNAGGDDAIPARTFRTGNHARDLPARDTGRAETRCGECRAAGIWTQMDPSCRVGSIHVGHRELKTKK